MKRAVLIFALVVLSSAAAAETKLHYERVVLPISPSYSLCGYHSRYETNLLLYNGSDAVMSPICFGHDCNAVAPHTSSMMAGPLTNNPLPVYLYVPSDVVDDIHLTLMTESRNLLKAESASAYTQLPVIRESDFKNKITLIGVRVEEGFRVTSRVFGLDTPDGTLTVMRVYDMETGDLAYERMYELQTYPMVTASAAGGGSASKLASRPSFAMECDLSDLDHWYKGRPLRIEIVPDSPDKKIYGFLSVTDNETQRFTTITP
jgi:hypothetical protein